MSVDHHLKYLESFSLKALSYAAALLSPEPYQTGAHKPERHAIMSNKYNCHDLSELAQRYGGELRPVLGIAPSINGTVPVPSVLGAAAESDIVPVIPRLPF